MTLRKNIVCGAALLVATACAHAQRPAPEAARQRDPFDTPECHAREANARTFRAVGDFTTTDIEAIRREVAKVSPHPVTMVRKDPPGVEDLKAKYGVGLVEVETLADWWCLSSRGETRFFVRVQDTWRMVDEKFDWIACY